MRSGRPRVELEECAIALAPPETRLLLLSGSVANPEDVVEWLRRLGRPAVRAATRPSGFAAGGEG